jgi:hypothetical protein
VSAYVVLADNTTRLEGTVAVGDLVDNETRVWFYAKGQANKTVFKPEQLSEYGMEITELDDAGNAKQTWLRFFRRQVDRAPVLFASKTVMMQREVAGAYNLYCYYISTPDDVERPFKYAFYLETDGGSFAKIEKDDYKGAARDAFKEYPALQALVGSKGFLYRNLDRMVNDYNYWRTNQHDKNEYRVALRR